MPRRKLGFLVAIALAAAACVVGIVALWLNAAVGGLSSEVCGAFAGTVAILGVAAFLVTMVVDITTCNDDD